MESQFPLCAEQRMTKDPQACWGVNCGSQETLCLPGSSALSRCGEVFVGGRRETLVSLAFCRGP